MHKRHKNTRYIVGLAVLLMSITAACSVTNQTTPTDTATPAETTTFSPPSPGSGALEALLPFSGAWEGILDGENENTLRVDCVTDAKTGKVLVSMDVYLTCFEKLPANWEAKGDRLTAWWNDETHRATLTLDLQANGTMTASYTQYNETNEGTLEKISDTAVDGSFQVVSQERYMRLLADNADFKRDDTVAVDFSYYYDDPALTELRDTYDLTGVAGDGDTQSRVVNLLHWLCRGTIHNGNYSHEERNSLTLLEYAYHTGNGLNCNNLSVTLSEMCLSVGIQARALWLMPANPNDTDCHVVVMAYVPERESWIMVDPTTNAYLTDKNKPDEILSPEEIRNRLAKDVNSMQINAETRTDFISYTNYLAKDMYYFSTMEKTGFGTFSNALKQTEGYADSPLAGNREIFLCPAGLDLPKWETDNNRYLNRVTDGTIVSEEDLARLEQEIADGSKVYTLAAPEDFWAVR